MHVLAMTRDIHLPQRRQRTQEQKNKRGATQPKKKRNATKAFFWYLRNGNALKLLRLSCWLFNETNKYIKEVEIIYSIVFRNHLVASQSTSVSCFTCAYQLALKRRLIWSQLICFMWSSALNVTSL